MSFNIATSGLNAVTQQLSAISNNIANGGTVGYKSMRAEFASLYAGGQAMGVGVSSISQSISKNGGVNGSARGLDLAIAGNGFFMTKDSSGSVSYSRAGYMGTDSEGFVTNNLGKRVQGYPVGANGELQTGVVGDLKISSGSIPAKATDSLGFTGNLNANSKVPDVTTFDKNDSNSYNNTYTSKMYDSLGREHTLEQYFVKTGENKWEAHYFVDGQAATPATQALEFSTNGVLTAPTGAINVSAPIAGADGLDIVLDYAGTSQYGTEFNVSKNSQNGFAAGEKTGEKVDDDGKIYATYSNGERMLQGQLVLANFSNPNGLSSEDGTAWSATNLSGQPMLGVPKSGLNGSIQNFALEGSNVDMTEELVGLMSAQRNYQANTKVISTNDSMMNALFQAL
ncbi:flagellar basal body protein FlgE [Pantoea sp. BIGb0393]|uniref:Flagellar hook protein FlgE n=1 Tax=Pantoea nemavictus TaxID=2726955 RepID=A0ABU8PS75_9GAMM|nr:flagellar hook protein FlgE [Pantoea nemavictus]MBA0035849.1 flagellar basal body protein FlgE [Pantoea nemavictus]